MPPVTSADADRDGDGPAAPTLAQAPEPADEARVGGPAVRPRVLLLGAGGALVAGLLAAGALPAPVVLAGVVLVGQLLLVLGLLALAEAPGALGAFAVSAAAAVAADVLVLVDDGAVGGLAGVVGLALVAALLSQLARRERSRVTEALADTLLCVILVVAAAFLVALRTTEGGRDTLLVASAAAAAALLAGRLADLVVRRPRLTQGAERGWVGLLLGLAAAGAVGVVLAGRDTGLTPLSGALLGLAVGACVSAADLAVDLSAVDMREGWRDARRVDALLPVGLLLPFAVLGPVAFVAGRLVLS